MTVKRTLQSRIRGWFPQEPHMMSTRFKAEYENKRQPPIIPPEYNVSATKTNAAIGIFLIIFFGYMTYASYSIARNPTLTLQVFAWIIASLAVGAISSIMFAQNQFNRLSKDYQVRTNRKDIALLVIPTFLLFVFCFALGASTFSISALT